ncbi:MAG: MFS transporter [Acidobacteria bacterium]|nr:MAG: MFS transporter [Acidobacteriota bacterium]
MADPDDALPDARGASTAARPALRLLARTFHAFRYRDFRIMWLGAFTSTTGTWMQMVAESWLVLSMTGSAFYLGLTGFLGEMPMILFSLLGGVVADRVERRKMLLGSQYVQMTCAFILTFLVYFGLVRIPHLLILVFIVGTARSFGGPAYQALIPNLVEREALANAIALNSIQFNLARVLGPLLAGATFAAFGATLCFAFNGISFLAVIVSLYLIHSSFRPVPTTDSVWSGMRKGFSFVKSKGALWQLSVLGFITAFCGIPLVTLLPVFAKDIFHTGAAGYSKMMAVSGAGAVTGALLYAAFAGLARRGYLTLRVQLIFASFLVMFALSRNLILSYLILFCAGVCLMVLFASITSLVQLATTEEMRGRVMSIFMLAFRGGMPIGNLVAGFLASQFSPALTLMLLGGVLTVSALAFLFFGSGVKEL